MNQINKAVKSRSALYVLFIVATLAASGCATNQSGTSAYTDFGYYANHTNSQMIRQQIQGAFQSVLRIQSNVIYRTYQFYIDDMPNRSEVLGRDLEDISVDSYIDDQSTAGTAIVVSGVRDRFTLLTAAHTVNFPDTVWHYSRNSIDSDDPQVEAVSVRRSTNHFVLMDNGIIKLDLVLSDAVRDLAVMTNNRRTRNDLLVPLRIPLGNSDRLEFGDLVYALGYPKGAKMVTTGTASRSENPRRSIIIDASFNRGFSGGAVFGVRNNGSGLEMLGVVTSALGETETYLTPERAEFEDYNPEVPYRGELYVRQVPRINYGITNAVDIEEIRAFFRENASRLNRMGLSVP